MRKTNTGVMALGGVLTALAVGLLLLTATPIATVGTVALAAVCGIPVVAEVGRRGALIHVIAVAVLAWLLVPSPEGKMMYTAFFGWYTVFKAWLEQKNLPRLAEWGVKYGVFAAAVAVYSAVWVFLLDMALPDWPWGLPLAAVVLGVVFTVYDRCLTGLVGIYVTRSASLRRMFRME